MIKRITVKNHVNETIELELTKPEITGLLIKSIEGLGPSKANINMTEYVTNDGSLFNSSHVTSRQLILSIKPLGEPLVEDSRLKVYRYFPIKQYITFTVETDNRICKTEAYVEAVEPDIFTNDEGISVTLTCPDAYFRSLSPYILEFRSVDPLFTFPFCNDSLVNKLLIMGRINPTSSRELFYDGDAEVGINIIVKIHGKVRGLAMFNGADRERSIRMNDEVLKQMTGGYLELGDEVYVSTIKGKRGTWLIRDGKRYNIINAFERPVGWMTIGYGENVFAYEAREGEELLDFSIEYDILYMGV